MTAFAGNTAQGHSGDGRAATSATLHSPSEIAFDTAGNVYIADYQNLKIHKVDWSGKLSTFAGAGLKNYSGDGGAATAATLSGPSDAALG